MLLLHIILIKRFCTGLDNNKGTMYYRSREFSLVHGKSDNNFYIMLSIHEHDLKQLALGGYSLSFFHIRLQVVETDKLVSYELVGGHCYPLIILKTLPSICYI